MNERATRSRRRCPRARSAAEQPANELADRRRRGGDEPNRGTGELVGGTNDTIGITTTDQRARHAMKTTTSKRALERAQRERAQAAAIGKSAAAVLFGAKVRAAARELRLAGRVAARSLAAAWTALLVDLGYARAELPRHRLAWQALDCLGLPGTAITETLSALEVDRKQCAPVRSVRRALTHDVPRLLDELRRYVLMPRDSASWKRLARRAGRYLKVERGVGAGERWAVVARVGAYERRVRVG